MADTTLGKAAVEGGSAGVLAATVAMPFVTPDKAAAIGAAVTLLASVWKAIRHWRQKKTANTKRRRADDTQREG